MKKICFIIFVFLFGSIYSSYIDVSENGIPYNSLVYIKNDKNNFTARFISSNNKEEDFSDEKLKLRGFDYNFGKTNSQEGYLKNDECELKYIDNILNAYWSGEEENIFGFLKGKNEKLAKDILKANLMMKVQINYIYDGGNNNSYIYIDDDGVDLNEIKRNLRKDLLKKKFETTNIKITSFQANDSKCNFGSNEDETPPLILHEEETSLLPKIIEIKFPNFQIATENKDNKKNIK